MTDEIKILLPTTEKTAYDYRGRDVKVGKRKHTKDGHNIEPGHHGRAEQWEAL